VSNILKISETEERVFEISYNYVEKKYFVETYETRIKSDGYRIPMQAGSSLALWMNALIISKKLTM
jgi:hypothetical protein